MPMQSGGSEHGIVRLVRREPATGEYAHVGLGMLVDAVTVVTCAHVVNVCLGRALLALDRPGVDDDVETTFPIVSDGEPIPARVVGWSEPGTGGLDCAVLTLRRPAPKDAGLTILSAIEGDDVVDDPLSVYGSLEPGHPGAHVRARLSGSVGAAWTQLDVDGRAGVQPGFSGGAVWDKAQRSAVGMIVARALETAEATAYFLSAARIAAAFGDRVPVEIRRIPLRRQRWFTGVAGLLFLLMLVHFLANRTEATLPLVPWAQSDPHLAAFFGLHCFAVFLGPYVMWSAMTHARSFALRPWWQRVPAAFGQRAAEALDNTRLGSLAVILFLLLLPAYAQGFFLERVLGKGPEIYVSTSAFTDVPPENFDLCRTRGDFCTHPDAGQWSLLDLSPYFDHVYQIGGQSQCRDGTCMVTFFPIIQPAILWGASLVALVWFLMFLAALVHPWPYAPRLSPYPRRLT